MRVKRYITNTNTKHKKCKEKKKKKKSKQKIMIVKLLLTLAAGGRVRGAGLTEASEPFGSILAGLASIGRYSSAFFSAQCP